VAIGEQRCVLLRGQRDLIQLGIVASADLGVDLNLNAIAIGLGLENIEYEPEQFPGLVYRLDKPRVVVLIFGSGKMVVTGGKNPEDAVKDVITGFEGRPIKGPDDLIEEVGRVRAGKGATVTLIRDGSEMTIRVVIGRKGEKVA